MKKKYLVLLLIAVLSVFLLAGCNLFPPKPEPEPEPEPTLDNVKVEFSKEYRDGDRIYVKGGDNTITVTFPAPVTGMVQVDLSDCTGNYAKGGTYLFPNTDRTVWTGSVSFVCGYMPPYTPCDTSCHPVDKPCCATTVTIISGACEADTCIAFPVIVDCDKPFAELEIAPKDCCCSECAVTIKSVADPEEEECGVCPPSLVPCCGDDCSGLASWKVDWYRVKVDLTELPDPEEHGDDFFEIVYGLIVNSFADCCEISPCAKFITSCEGEDCPIECTLDCMEEDEYWKNIYFAIVTLKDNVGNTQKYYAGFVTGCVALKGEERCHCRIAGWEGCCEKDEGVRFFPAWGIFEDPTKDGFKKFTIGGCKGDDDCFERYK